jgi:aldose 1-epimerase
MTVQAISLSDPASGARASILPGFGFNCYRFAVPVAGRPVEVLWAEPGFESGQKRASGSGIPLLLPYPGRLRGQTLQWRGRAYPLEGDDHRGNAIHGYVLNRPWRVIEQGAARVVGQFQASVDDPSLRDRWPADFRITATYALSGTALSSEFLIENPSDQPLPCGFGTHPYFRVPLAAGDAAECRVALPVTRRWELADMLPTGRQLNVDEPDTFRRGLPFPEMQFDDVFTGLQFEREWCHTAVVDPRGGCRLAVEFDAAFRECVVYNPPHREAVCIEPYTCVPNAIELTAGGADTGLQVLEPGQSFRARVVMRVEEL